jgi:hypothetical protein
MNVKGGGKGFSPAADTTGCIFINIIYKRKEKAK